MCGGTNTPLLYEDIERDINNATNNESQEIIFGDWSVVSRKLDG